MISAISRAASVPARHFATNSSTSKIAQLVKRLPIREAGIIAYSGLAGAGAYLGGSFVHEELEGSDCGLFRWVAIGYGAFCGAVLSPIFVPFEHYRIEHYRNYR